MHFLFEKVHQGLNEKPVIQAVRKVNKHSNSQVFSCGKYTSLKADVENSIAFRIIIFLKNALKVQLAVFMFIPLLQVEMELLKT